jgi:A/G-specific adenine glycosylase
MDDFRQTVWQYYKAHGRHDLPWRQPESNGSIDPYKVLVSELMLQQTQVPRVIPKFISFITQFPTFQSLANAPLAQVLTAWSGLGYNRRAKFLWQAAQVVVSEHDGRLPDTLAELIRLPGVGSNTAGALLAYVYNKPAVFIETNIRTVFIHHFFADQERVSDRAIADIVVLTLPNPGPGRATAGLPQANPALPKGRNKKPTERVSHYRNWYWALMDYGAYLKQTIGNLNKASKHYAKQSAFVGSRRQIRGQVIRMLSVKPHTMDELSGTIGDERLSGILQDLLREELVQQSGLYYKLAGA